MTKKCAPYDKPKKGQKKLIWILNEGEEVEILEEKENGWSQVKKADGEIGWIASTNIKKTVIN